MSADSLYIVEDLANYAFFEGIRSREFSVCSQPGKIVSSKTPQAVDKDLALSRGPSRQGYIGTGVQCNKLSHATPQDKRLLLSFSHNTPIPPCLQDVTFANEIILSLPHPYPAQSLFLSQEKKRMGLFTKKHPVAAEGNAEAQPERGRSSIQEVKDPALSV